MRRYRGGRGHIILSTQAYFPVRKCVECNGLWLKNNGLGVTDMGEYRDILLGTLDDLTATTFAERLERFYAHNGYDKVSPSLRGEESAWEELSAWERGKRGSGWWRAGR